MITKRILSCTIAGAVLLSIGHIVGNQRALAEESAPTTVAELLAAMKLTESQ